MPSLLAAARREATSLLSIAAAQPQGSLKAAELGAPFGRTSDWIGARTGIRRVRRSAHVQDIERLAAQASRTALAHAGLASSEIDLVITASCTLAPPVSARMTQCIAPSAAHLPVNVACSGFCYALGVADSLVRAGDARHVLIVAAEHMSSLLDPADLGTSIIFGDGAGAAVVGPSPDGRPGIGPTVWGSNGDLAAAIACDDTGLLRMSGQQVFRWAVEHVPAIARAASERAGVTLADIAAFIPHQANLRIIDAVVAKLGLEHAVTARDIADSGNTSAASIPIAMTALLADTPSLAGRPALLVGFGAGLAFAGQVVDLPTRLQ